MDYRKLLQAYLLYVRIYEGTTKLWDVPDPVTLTRYGLTLLEAEHLVKMCRTADDSVAFPFAAPDEIDNLRQAKP